MHVIVPAVAGQFYPDSPRQCRAEAEGCLSAGSVDAGALANVIGGIVPHAGWMFSGAVAGAVIRAITQSSTAETLVVFGAVHRRSGPEAMVYTSGKWQTPLGDIPIDEALASAVTGRSPSAVEDLVAHGPEHSIEVEVPFVQLAAPRAKLLPVMVPPTETAHEIGAMIAQEARRLARRVAYLGSSDLTHYGPRYGFTPAGDGPEGLSWARDVNDRRMLDLILAFRADEIVPEARAHHNACGAGAIAATVAACRADGADSARLLRHTTSADVMGGRFRGADAVGYAGIVFGRSASL